MPTIQLPSKIVIDNTIAALRNNNIEAIFVSSAEDAFKKVIELIPKGAEVMNMTSVTLATIGIDKEINESGNYRSVRGSFEKIDKKTQGLEMQKMGAAPEYVVGSVHAVTEDGHVLVASNTGSQLPAYVYGSPHVVWVVGAQKIVKDLDAGMKRIYDYVLPLENERAKKAYGVGSAVNKLLMINKEVQPGRINMIIVNDILGF